MRTIEEIKKQIQEVEIDDYNWWCNISRNKILTEAFIDEYKYYVSWFSISANQKLSEAFMESHEDFICWPVISTYQNLSEAFMETHQDKISWTKISAYQKLTEAFIEKHQDKVWWYAISSHQKLSESFIEKFQDKVTWPLILGYQKLSKEFIEKHSKHIGLDKDCLEHAENPIKSWLYATVKEKKEYIKNYTSYPIKGNSIIAYKQIRADNYSTRNFQYLYEIGEEYEAHCDCYLIINNSFGLSAWTKEQIKRSIIEGGFKEYCKILKVKINIEDIGAIVQHQKIRCSKLKVLAEVR
jgi:hypothetical protein